jgi:type 1 glutamine amidotransferase
MHRVLFITNGSEHPTYACRKELIQTLTQVKDISYDHIESLELLPNDLRTFAALVLYFHEQQLSERALILFDQFVEKGGGVLAVHSATVSFMDSSHYFEILGGRFMRHGPIMKFQITPVENGTDTFSGIPPFSVEDELYVHDLQPEITPHFTALDGTKEVPVVWTHRYRRGRVCYAVPGHRIETIRHPDYQNLLRQGLSWVIGA